jgi:hypothetical protein
MRGALRLVLFTTVLTTASACNGKIDPASRTLAPAAASDESGDQGPSGSPAAPVDGVGRIDVQLHGDYAALACDDTHCYAAGLGGIVRAPMTGGTPDVLTTEDGFKEGIAVDEAYVYYTRIVAGEVVRIPKGGGAAEVLASGLMRPWGIAVDDARVYWAAEGDVAAGVSIPAGGQIAAVSKTGGAVTVLASNEQRPLSLVLEGDDVYFADGDWGDANGMIKRVPKSGGNVTTLASGRDLLGVPTLAVASGWLAWSEMNGLQRMPVGGGAIERIGPGGQLTSDGQSLFFALSNGRVADLRAYDAALPDGRPLGSTTHGSDQTWFLNAVVASAHHLVWLDYWWSYKDPGPYSAIHVVAY